MGAFDQFKKEVANLPADSDASTTARQYEDLKNQAQDELRRRQAKERQERFGK